MKKTFVKIFTKIFKNVISKYQLRALKNSKDSIKIILGSGYTSYKGWVATDIDVLNITKEKDWETYFEKDTISSILAEHVWEHLTENDCTSALLNCYQYLKKGGNLRIAVPDGFHPDQEYINHVKPGGTGPGATDHKFLYTYPTLSKKLENIGFNVQLLEYFDEKKKFVKNEWNPEHGMIQRSADYDSRNQNGGLKYTSLIIDAIK